MALSANYSSSPVTVSTTAETTALASTSVTPFGASSTVANGPYAGLSVRGVVNVTLGSAATSTVLRVRQGATTAGTAIGQPYTITTVALAATQLPFYVFDQAGLPQTQYNVTLACPAATTNAVVNSAQIETDIVL